MKNLPLLLALAVSLAANVWFAFGRGGKNLFPDRTASGAATTAANSATARAAAGDKVAGGDSTRRTAVTPYVWKNPGPSVAELRAFAADLRAAGFPPAIVVRFVGEMLRDRTYAAVLALPHWQLLSPGNEARKLQNQAARELLRWQEEILGPSGTPVATLDPLERAHRFGALADDKVAALLRIERDYDEVRGTVFSAGAFSSEDMSARREQYRTLEKERLADIAAALTPEEFADWERRESGAAKRVMSALHNVTVTEEEYAALLAAQKAREPTGTQFGVVSFDDSARDLPAAFGFIDRVRAALGDERASAYLKSADFSYAQTSNFMAKHPEIPVAKGFDLYRIQTEAQALMLASRNPGVGGAPSPTAAEQMRKDMIDLNARLDALLGKDAAEAYRSQGVGSWFRAFSPRPPASPPAAPPRN